MGKDRQIVPESHNISRGIAFGKTINKILFFFYNISLKWSLNE